MTTNPTTNRLAKERRSIARLTPEAMIDEIIGLRADLADANVQAEALSAEGDDLKAKWMGATASGMGLALRHIQIRGDKATVRMGKAMTAIKRIEPCVKAAEARVRELENTPIDMGRP